MQQTATMTRPKTPSGLRRVHRLMDEVYREMYLLEAARPGAEMGLALALLRARVAADHKSEEAEDWEWLKALLPICLAMIEQSLDRGSTVSPLLHSSTGAARKS